MDNFRMELHAVEAALFIAHGSKRRVAAVANHLKTGRQFLNAVSVTHPDLQFFFRRKSGKQVFCSINAKLCFSIFALLRWFHFAVKQE